MLRTGFNNNDYTYPGRALRTAVTISHGYSSAGFEITVRYTGPQISEFTLSYPVARDFVFRRDYRLAVDQSDRAVAVYRERCSSEAKINLGGDTRIDVGNGIALVTNIRDGSDFRPLGPRGSALYQTTETLLTKINSQAPGRALQKTLKFEHWDRKQNLHSSLTDLFHFTNTRGRRLQSEAYAVGATYEMIYLWQPSQIPDRSPRLPADIEDYSDITFRLETGEVL